MDWFKIKTNHVLFEYADLSDSDFRAWIKSMALTASIGHIPTDKQLLGIMHHKTLRSVQERFKDRSRNLQGVLKKVVEDVEKLNVKKDYEKEKKRIQRLKKNNQENKNSFLNIENVPGEVPRDVPMSIPGEVPRDVPMSIPGEVPRDVLRNNRREDKIRSMLSTIPSGTKHLAYNNDNIPIDLKDIIPEELKDELSSLFFVKSFFEEIGLSEDFKMNGKPIDFESSGVLELIASLYTKTRKKAEDKEEYADSVKRGLLGRDNKSWDVSEVLIKTWKYSEKRINEIVSKYRELNAQKINHAESDAYNQKRRMAKDMLIDFTEKQREELIQEAIENIGNESLGGLPANQNHPAIREEMYRIILQKAGIK